VIVKLIDKPFASASGGYIAINLFVMIQSTIFTEDIAKLQHHLLRFLQPRESDIGPSGKTLAHIYQEGVFSDSRNLYRRKGLGNQILFCPLHRGLMPGHRNHGYREPLSALSPLREQVGLCHPAIKSFTPQCLVAPIALPCIPTLPASPRTVGSYHKSAPKTRYLLYLRPDQGAIVHHPGEALGIPATPQPQHQLVVARFYQRSNVVRHHIRTFRKLRNRGSQHPLSHLPAIDIGLMIP